ncbi:MAG: HAD family hydrolase, partial [bacterium]|nr:HAD family hydrolase [bacterium]
MKVVFLDRDGVINKDPQEKFYVMKWSDFHFLPGAISAVKKLNKTGFKIAIISNQAGVGKELFKRGVLRSITKKMLAKIKARGGKIKKVYYCLHRSQDNCPCRKPKTGLLKKAFLYFKAAPSDTFFIGDSEVDVIAGHKMGCRT